MTELTALPALPAGSASSAVTVAVVPGVGGAPDTAFKAFLPVAPTLPILAAVATSGSYVDLVNKPALPAAANLAPYALTASLAPVALSGNYADLAGKPVIPVLPILAPVAISGAYADLTGRPTIPPPPGLATTSTPGLVKASPTLAIAADGTANVIGNTGAGAASPTAANTFATLADATLLQIRQPDGSMAWTSIASLRSTLAQGPVAPNGLSVCTFDYLPARDGLALLHGGPAEAGYAASAAANPVAAWTPRYLPFGSDPRGCSDVPSGNSQWNVDPEYPWSNGFSPFAIDGGCLRIRAQRTSTLAFAPGELPTNPATGQPYAYVSGIICSKERFSQQYGYFEFEAKLPKGNAAWPAFYLMPAGETHPPELDVLEYLPGYDPATTYRTTAIALGPTFFQQSAVAAVDLSLDFHCYGMGWTDTAVTWWLDGVQVASQDISARPEFGQPFYLIIANQVGSTLAQWVPPADGNTPNILDLLIRRVRANQAEGPVGINLSATSYLDSLPAGSTVAAISTTAFGCSTGNAVTKAIDPDGVFAISDNALTITQQVPATTKVSHQVRLQVTDAQGRSRSRLFTLGVTLGIPSQANYLANLLDLRTGWSVVNGAGIGSRPDARTLLEDTTNGQHGVNAAAAITRAVGAHPYCVFMDVTPDLGRPWIHIKLWDGTYAAFTEAWFNVAGTALGYSVGTGGFSGVTPFVTAIGGGKVRCGYSFTTDAATTNFQLMLLAATGQDGDSYQGVSSDGLHIDNLWLYRTDASAGSL